MESILMEEVVLISLMEREINSEITHKEEDLLIMKFMEKKIALEIIHQEVDNIKVTIEKIVRVHKIVIMVIHLSKIIIRVTRIMHKEIKIIPIRGIREILNEINIISSIYY